MTVSERSGWHGRGALLGLIAVFVVPLIAAVVLYMAASRWDFLETTHRGQLYDPPRALEGVALQRIGTDEPLDERFLNGHWTMLLVGSSRCSESCQEALYHMRQIRAAQGRDMGRVQRLFVATDDRDLPRLQTLIRESYRGTVVARDTGEGRDSLQGVLAVNGEPEPGDTARIYLVDPRGFVMMRYAEDADPMDIHDDLEHLLKVSRAG